MIKQHFKPFQFKLSLDLILSSSNTVRHNVPLRILSNFIASFVTIMFDHIQLKISLSLPFSISNFMPNNKNNRQIPPGNIVDHKILKLIWQENSRMWPETFQDLGFGKECSTLQEVSLLWFNLRAKINDKHFY